MENSCNRLFICEINCCITVSASFTCEKIKNGDNIVSLFKSYVVNIFLIEMDGCDNLYNDETNRFKSYLDVGLIWENIVTMESFS